MPAWLLPLALTAASAASTIFTNKKNQENAEAQMDFQERMSSTAAQRSAKDYAAAGLNPALAYDRTASSPGGVSATVGDVGNNAINAYWSARANEKALLQADAQRNMTDAQANMYDQQARQASSQVKINQELGARAMNENAILNETKESQIKGIRAANALTEYELPGAKAEADFNQMLGKFGPGMNSAKTAAEIIKMLIPSRRSGGGITINNPRR